MVTKNKLHKLCLSTVNELKTKGLTEDIATEMVVENIKLSGGDLSMLKLLFKSLIQIA